MNEIQALERVILLDAAEEVDAAGLAGVALDGGAGVEDVQFLRVGSHFDVVDGHDGDDGEERAFGLPALRAAAGVVVEDVAGDGYFYFVAGAVALEGSSREVGCAFSDAIVDQGVDRWCHVECGCFIFGGS